EKIIGGKKKTIGSRVVPKSSPLFQEFKIWQNLSNVVINKKVSRKYADISLAGENSVDIEENPSFIFDLETKESLFEELNLKGNLTSSTIIKSLGYKTNEWELNFSSLEGNRTNQVLYDAYLKIIEQEGYDVKELLKLKLDKDEVVLSDLNV